MVHKESIGKVIGNDGKTYKPIISQSSDGSECFFTFQLVDGTPPETIDEAQPINLPYLYPEAAENGIEFHVGVWNPLEQVSTPTIPYSELKGPKGDDGKINVEIVDFTEIDLTATDNNGDYVFKDNTIYIDVADNVIGDTVDAWVIYTDTNNTRQLQKINSVINLGNYYTKTEIDDKTTEINNRINREVSNIMSQQQSIYSILTEGTIIADEDYTTGENVINVMSDASVEDLKNQIYQELENYIRDNDLTLDVDSGRITW